MRQRVAIASAEAIDPDIYVMDEPSANLDMGATEAVSYTHLDVYKRQALCLSGAAPLKPFEHT